MMRGPTYLDHGVHRDEGSITTVCLGIDNR